MNTIEVQKAVNEIIRNDFIEALIYFSDGKVSIEEANAIADKEWRLKCFVDGSPLGHKGPRWLANYVLRSMKRRNG
jgi:hypothetical protein